MPRYEIKGAYGAKIRTNCITLFPNDIIEESLGATPLLRNSPLVSGFLTSLAGQNIANYQRPVNFFVAAASSAGGFAGSQIGGPVASVVVLTSYGKPLLQSTVSGVGSALGAMAAGSR